MDSNTECGKMICCAFGIARHEYGHNYPIYDIKFHDLYKDFLVEKGNFFIKELSIHTIYYV